MKKLITLLMILALAASLSGCKAHAEKPVHVTFVVSPHKYAGYPYVDFTKPDISSLLEQACVDGSIAAVTVEGTPQYIEPEQVLKIDKSLSSFRQNQVINNYLNCFSSTLKSTVAKSEEADIIKALILAGRSLSDYTGRKIVVIATTGIQTINSLNMTNRDIRSIDINQTITRLKEENLLADLKGCEVSVYGIGDLIDASVTEKERAVLEDLWDAYLKESGAISVTISHDPYQGEVPDQTVLPNVTLSRSESSQSSLLTAGYRLTEQHFSIFKPDSAEFVDVYQLKSSLTELIDLLKKNPEKELLICGTTATAGSEEGAIELSQKRAEAFVNLLCELDVHNSMLAVGLGYNNKFHQNDTDEHGKLIPELAKANRAVIVLDRSTTDINNLFTKEGKTLWIHM